MSLLLAVTLAATVQPSCSWDHPGNNPYTGTTAAAIDRYTDIPATVRDELKRRIATKQVDDSVNITRDAISGKQEYNPTIRDMYFGKASRCTSVTRRKWAEDRIEPAAVYCVDQHCILVPRICGNVSRISKAAPPLAAAPTTSAISEAAPPPQFADISLQDAPTPEPISLDDLDDEGRPRKLAAIPPGVQTFVNNNTDGEHPIIPGVPVLPTVPDDTPVSTPVPEADTWAMLLAGLGLTGWAARRRLRRDANAGPDHTA